MAYAIVAPIMDWHNPDSLSKAQSDPPPRESDGAFFVSTTTGEGGKERDRTRSSPITTTVLWGTLLLLFTCAPLRHAVAQPCVPPPAGLVSWWPGEGDARDVVGGNDGTLQGGVSFTPGKVGQTFVFDGIDAFVHVGNPENLKVSTGITLAAWVNPHALPPPDDGALSGIFAIVTKWGQSTIADSYGIWLHNPDGNIRLMDAIVAAGVGDGGLRNGGSLPIGQWSYVAMTYESATGLNRLYVNGVQVAERVRAAQTSSPTARACCNSPKTSMSSPPRS